MKLSVIIPVYNAERFLARCLDSVLAAAANLPPGDSAEIICVDDGSTDSSAAILARYASKVRVVPQPHGGQSAARNLGLDLMSGDFVAFVDSDDQITSDSLRLFLSVARRSGQPLVVSSSFAKDVLPPASPKGDVRFKIRRAAEIAGRKVQYSVCNKLFAAPLVRSRRFASHKFEDFAYMTEVFCDIDTFAEIDRPLYAYNTNAGGTSTIHSPFDAEKLASAVAVARHVLAYAKGRPCFPFALRQAADGHSSTIGKVYKSKDASLRRTLLAAHRALAADCPDLPRRLSLKAKLRLRRMIRKEKATDNMTTFEKLAEKLQRDIIGPVDRQLIEYAFEPRPTQARLDELLKVWDIEVAGAGKAMALAYVKNEHPELTFNAYTGPRLAGLFNRTRFANLQLVSHYGKIGRALNAAGIVPLLVKGGAMKHLRPERPRIMGDFDILVRDEAQFARACEIILSLGYVIGDENEVHSKDFKEPVNGAGVLDVHRYLDFGKPCGAAFTERLFAHAAKVRAFGVETFLPRHEDLAFIAIANLSKNLRNTTSIPSIVNAAFDVAWLAQAKPDFSWPLVYEDVRLTGMEYAFATGAAFIDRNIRGVLPREATDYSSLGRELADFSNEMWFTLYHRTPVRMRCKKLRIGKAFASWTAFKTYVSDELYHQVLKHIDEHPRRVAWWLRHFDKEVGDAC